MLDDDGLRPVEAGEHEIVRVPQAEPLRASEEAVVPWLGADPAEADQALAARPFIPREPLFLAKDQSSES